MYLLLQRKHFIHCVLFLGLGLDTEELLQLMAERGMVGGTVFIQTTREDDQCEADRSCKEKPGCGQMNDCQLAAKRQPLSENIRAGNKQMTETEAYTTSVPLVSYTPHPLKENKPIAVTKKRKVPQNKEYQLLEVILYALSIK